MNIFAYHTYNNLNNNEFFLLIWMYQKLYIIEELYQYIYIYIKWQSISTDNLAKQKLC